MDIYKEILSNKILWTSLFAWATAQVLKVLFTLIFTRRFDITRFVGAGGMPSSHSALIVSLATSVGLYNGFDTPIFALSLVVAFIVMYDAAGVRRAVGKQATVLNEMITEYKKEHSIKEEKLIELIGHTPIQVIAGALLGIIVSWLLF